MTYGCHRRDALDLLALSQNLGTIGKFRPRFFCYGSTRYREAFRREYDDTRDRQAYDATIAGIFIVLMLVVIVLIFAMS